MKHFLKCHRHLLKFLLLYNVNLHSPEPDGWQRLLKHITKRHRYPTLYVGWVWQNGMRDDGLYEKKCSTGGTSTLIKDCGTYEDGFITDDMDSDEDSDVFSDISESELRGLGITR